MLAWCTMQSGNEERVDMLLDWMVGECDLFSTWFKLFEHFVIGHWGEGKGLESRVNISLIIRTLLLFEPEVLLDAENIILLGLWRFKDLVINLQN